MAGVGLGDLQGSLPRQTMLCFYDHPKLLSLGVALKTCLRPCPPWEEALEVVLHQCQPAPEMDWSDLFPMDFYPRMYLGQWHHSAHSICPCEALPCHPAWPQPFTERPSPSEGVQRRRFWPEDVILEDPISPAGLRGHWEGPLPALGSSPQMSTESS